jgi:hypothetical protein
MNSLEIFQTSGAVVAFATGVIALYDRLLRYRPHVSIYARLDGANAWPMLRVTNMAPFDIFVDEITIKPPVLRLSQQQTQRAMMDVITGAKVTALIEPRNSADFHIINPDLNKTKDRTAEPIKFKVRWYRSRPTWIRPLAATIDTSIDDIDARKRAALRGHRT